MVLKLYLHTMSWILCQDVKGMVVVLHPSEKAAKHILDYFSASVSVKRQDKTIFKWTLAIFTVTERGKPKPKPFLSLTHTHIH